jgi:transcription-repair coupling factor (superfamily II helicase)
MLEDAIRELSGTDKDEEHQVDISLSVRAYISDELIYEDRLRLELYRRLSICDTVAEVYEIESEIADRFGKLDDITRLFIDVMVIKVLAKEKGVSKVSSYEQKVFIEFIDKSKDRVVLQSYSKDDDDIIETAMKYLKS